MFTEPHILVTGGAGYIGSHCVKDLIRRGYRPVVLDNLSTGHRAAVGVCPFIEGDMANDALLDEVFPVYDFRAVIHFAARCLVEESYRKPFDYFQANVADTLVLLQAMRRHGVRAFLFSSSAAVYGNPRSTPIEENHPTEPINPYGMTKLVIEQVLAEAARAYGMNYISLRYFNAAGADPEGELGEDHHPETHLIPRILRRALAERLGRRGNENWQLQVYGTDYPTRDGTCVRDYIHVTDLAEAHGLALDALLREGWNDVFNLGSEQGFTVKEVIQMAEQVTGLPIPYEQAPRRPGDPAVLAASSKKITQRLGWKPRYSDLETILVTAWTWYKEHPNGYISGES